MRRYWTCYWKHQSWRPDVNIENAPISFAGSKAFRSRGVSVGDLVYIVSLRAGQLYLGGRMTVKQIVSRPEAVRIFNMPRLYDDADEWIIDPDKSGTLLNLRRRLAPEVSRKLRFISATQSKALVFVSKTHLDNQTIRIVRELTHQSAALLDKIIEITDRLPRTGKLITVSENMLLGVDLPGGRNQVTLPEEVPSRSAYAEGSVERVLVNRYERDPGARQDCITHHGTKCSVCQFDFVARYGQVMAGFIQVHHLRSLSSLGSDYQIDPVQDLRPVCPNCHAVLHHREPPYSLEEVRHFLQIPKE